MLGLSFDWDREVQTCDPKYYKWTQWMFLQMFKHGLAYKAEIPINWCSSCKVALANEEVVNGRCERCGSQTIRKNKHQWMLRITQYADRLIEDLDTVNYIEPVKIQQRNWIGKSHGAEIQFQLAGHDDTLTVFTTRPDTLFGATYMVVAPEHPLIQKYNALIENSEQVNAYIQNAAQKSDLERSDISKEKSGVPLKGLYCMNPVTGKKIPIWVSDYVLITYGSGAIMAVPGHDQRDWEFAKKFSLPIVEVIAGGDISKAAYEDIDQGSMINSGFLNGLAVKEAIEKMTAWLKEHKLGQATINYKLRDWVFSRQRYWGEPIPLVHCQQCGWVPIPESDLPLLLPDVDDFRPSILGESPLSKAHDWINVPCPACGKPGKRETDTMPQWAGSCWYFMRYIDPTNDQAFCDPDKLAYWLPVDWYNGGMEHTTLHLLYSRFWYKFMYDQGLVPTSEPYARRTSHGMILGSDNEKMSKSRGNVVNPDEVINLYGADTMRMYEMYLGAFDQTTAWMESGVIGVHRFLNKVWVLSDKISHTLSTDINDLRLIHKTIKKVTERIERMKFNTAVAALIEFSNACSGKDQIPQSIYEIFIKLLFPFVPHLASELWEKAGNTDRLTNLPWPEFDPELAKDELITIPIQINGKLRDTIEVEAGLSQADVLELALQQEKIILHLQGKPIKRKIYIPEKMVNIVI
jgi:leucyl-tRNA synthetase